MLHIYSYVNHNNRERGKTFSISSQTTHSDANHVRFMWRLVKIIQHPILSNWYILLMYFSLLMGSLLKTKFLPERYMLLYSDLALSHLLMAVNVLVLSFIFPIILIQLSIGSLGNGVAMRKFLNWPGWLPLSRISLSFLLVDPIVIILYYFRLKHTVYLDMDTHIITMMALSVIVYLISFFVYVALESPLRSCLTIVQMKLVRRFAPQLSSSL